MLVSLGFSETQMFKRQSGLSLSNLDKLQRDPTPLARVRREPGKGQAFVTLDLEILTAVLDIVALNIHHDQELAANTRITLHLRHRDSRSTTHETLERLGIQPRLEHHAQRSRDESLDYHRRSGLSHFEFPF